MKKTKHFSIKQKLIKLTPFLGLIIFVLPAVWALFHPGFFVSDDGEWMIIRLTDFHRSIASGQIPVRWLARLNYEYGYPVVNFLYPGFLYLGEAIHLLGFNFVDSIKIILGLSLLFSGIFSYLWLARIFGRFPAFIGALFYIYAPYHLYDLYTRGSVGEILAIAVIPFCLWMIEKKNLPFLGLGYGFLIISHNTLVFLFTPILIIYMLLSRKPFLYAMRYTLCTILLGLGISAFFWLPALFDLKYTVFSNTLVINWQNAFFTAGHLRLLTWPGVLVFFLCLVFFKKMDKKTLLFWIIFPAAFVLMLPISKFLWQILPLNQIVQFSFRLLFLMIISGSFLSAFLLKQLNFRLRIIFGIVLAGLLFLFSANLIQPKSFFDKGEGFYTTNEDTTTVKAEYMPRWVKVPPSERPAQKVEILQGGGEIQNLIFNSKIGSFDLNLKEKSLVQINIIHFPGWQVWVDGKETAINYENEKGLMQLPLEKGNYRVTVKFSETPLRLFSDIITLFSLLVLGSLLVGRYVFPRK